MTPAEIAAAMHENTPGVGFAEAMAAHLTGPGCVIATPFVFLMFRPVGPETNLADPWQHKRGSDTCYVWAAAGDLAQMLELLAAMPDISAVAYHRHGRKIVRSRHEILKFRRRSPRGRQEPPPVPEAVRAADETDAEAAEGAEDNGTARG